MRFVHTSDWQIGKTFRFADEASQVLRDERLDAVARIGHLARAQGAPRVLVAGDVYDVETPSDRTLRQPVERMRAFPDIEWHLIPGNHDPHTPRGPWERLLRLQQADGLPANIHPHLTPEPVPMADGSAWLLPAVLTRRHAAADPTEPMDTAATPDGAICSHPGSGEDADPDPHLSGGPLCPARRDECQAHARQRCRLASEPVGRNGRPRQPRCQQ